MIDTTWYIELPVSHRLSTHMKKKKDIIDDRVLAEDEVRKAIGKKIREMRDKLGLTALQIATRLNVSREAITQIETGRNNISAVALWQLATLFHCDIEDFFPAIPDGFALTKVDLQKVAQEDQNAAQWAKRLFKTRK